MNTSEIRIPLAVNKTSATHRRLKLLRIAAKNPQDVHRLYTNLFTAVQMTVPNGKPLEGLLVRKADHFLLLLTAVPGCQSKAGYEALLGPQAGGARTTTK